MSLSYAPKIYEKLDQLPAMMNALILSTQITRSREVTRARETTLPNSGQFVIGSCATYRFTLLGDMLAGTLSERLRSLTSRSIPLERIRHMPPQAPVSDFQQQVNHLMEQFKPSDWTFECRFQVQALWTNSLLSPLEIQQLIPTMVQIRNQSDTTALAKVLQNLRSQLRVADIRTGGVTEARHIMLNQHQLWSATANSPSVRALSREEVLIHRVTITPTGMFLEGPEEVVANRVLRQHRDNQSFFLRVSFTEEDWDRIQFERDTSNERVLRGRFLDILHQGLDIGGEHFDFLGFSHSSLRSQTCWFMRPFVHNGELFYAGRLIESLGDFTSIRSPAKCAARIGQAFSETPAAIAIDPKTVSKCSDVRCEQHLFTDGCGTASRATWRLLKKASSSQEQPTLYQIRYKGAKGMISLDTRLQGHQLRLRDSMIKFTGSPSDDLEICGTNARPLSFKLNRQLIKILRDLGVKPSTFEELQQNAVDKLRGSTSSVASAVDFLKLHLADSVTGLPTLLKALTDIDIDVTEDGFLREILGALLQVQLREIKYRSRIHVPQAVTLYGICDETDFLKEGQVFVTYADSGKHLHLNREVAVTRSPALHPGDVQVAEAVAPPEDSCLWDLHNCIVFSRQGSRDLPSMLSGGDLDGDLYNIIYDSRLLPAQVERPAAYSLAQAMDIGRPVTVNVVTAFFIDFMQNDQLGRIATLHQVIADGPEGTRSTECLKLAELHSTAVDFSKTGVKVDIRQIPRTPAYRPDFMAPSASIKVEKGIERRSDPLSEALEGRQRYRYFESERILGRLYRAIDEDLFFGELEDDTSSLFSSAATDNVLPEILKFISDMMRGQDWKRYLPKAREVRDYYESNIVLHIMSTYATSRTDYLTEKEVFIGSIIGRSGAGNKWQREQSEYMKVQFKAELRDLRAWMKDETSDTEDGFLCLAAACVYVAVREPPNVSTGKLEVVLKSFGWYAAGLCVPQLVDESNEGKDVDFGGWGLEYVSG
ncbi:hypothetical protein LTR51_005153 [Lithohypha guttulata]|nr:hypothetical protein LTR51_005153 [Lithohypha guttulata]